MAGKYDYVIVGAGAAGCVLANRLSENPSVRVALIESGPDRNSRKAIVRIPLGMVTFMAPALSWLGGPRFMQWFRSEPEAGLDGRQLDLPRGRGTGGSTLVNGQIYIRGQREDYDHWRELGNVGWGYDDLLPLFRKLERFEPLAEPTSDDHLPAADERQAHPVDPEFHSVAGNLNLAHLRSANPLTGIFMKAARLAGLTFNPDFNGVCQKGFGFYTFTHDKGERVTAESAYIDPVRHRANLSILSGRTVTRVIMQDKQARGVSWQDTEGNTGETLGEETILSAGSFVSPHLLLLSGIGAAGQLARQGIPVVHDLPGVGENLQDHLDVTVEYKARGHAPYAASWRALPSNIHHMANWLVRRRGLFASTTAEGGAFVSTTDSERPDAQLFFCTAMANTQYAAGYGTHGFLMHVCALRPGSIGRLSLKSADASVQPKITYNFFQGDSTPRVLRDGIRLARRIISQEPFKPHLETELAPGEDVQSDEALDAFIRQNASTLFHPVGTCAMGVGPQAVVDPASLRVHGISGLRVVDASVMPCIVSGNTVAATYCIAEKAAELILQAQCGDSLKNTDKGDADKPPHTQQTASGLADSSS